MTVESGTSASKTLRLQDLVHVSRACHWSSTAAAAPHTRCFFAAGAPAAPAGSWFSFLPAFPLPFAAAAAAAARSLAPGRSRRKAA